MWVPACVPRCSRETRQESSGRGGLDARFRITWKEGHPILDVLAQLAIRDAILRGLLAFTQPSVICVSDLARLQRSR
jgi:hypothetical protein